VNQSARNQKTLDRDHPSKAATNPGLRLIEILADSLEHRIRESTMEVLRNGLEPVGEGSVQLQ
jgi:hypothetical protein